MEGTKFESTTRNSGAGNGKLLIVRSGQILEKNSAGEMDKRDLPTGEDAAFVGTYEGSTPNKYDPLKADRSIRLEDGTLVILNETANIRRGFEGVQLGELVRIVYHGLRTMTKGKNAGKTVHDFDVQRAISEDTAG